jgi:uncharacterized protein YvpB
MQPRPNIEKILHVPYIDQTARWVNGCESVSAVMLLQYLGIKIDPEAFIKQHLPHAPFREEQGRRIGPDPHFVYPGDPRVATGPQAGVGCYAPCICAALESALAANGMSTKYDVKDETGKTAAELCEEYIDAGLPVVFWATLNFEPCEPPEYWFLEDGREFAWVSHEHCLLLVGYDEEGFYFNDPWQNHGLVRQPKALVEQRHREQGMYAVGVRPKK